MAIIQRPVKTYGTRSYVQEVSLAPNNYDPVLANEVDADLDAVYLAWNGGVDTINIKDGAVTTAKLAPGTMPWTVVGNTLAPTDSTKTVALAPIPNALQWSPRAVKGRLLGHDTADIAYWTLNGSLSPGSAAWVQDDNTKPSWLMHLRNDTDRLQVNRLAATGTPNTVLMTLDNGGNLTAGGALYPSSVAVGGASVSAYKGGGANSPVVQVIGNDHGVPGGIASRPAWMMRCDTDADQFGVWRRPNSTGAWAEPLYVANDLKTYCTLANGIVTPAMIQGSSITVNQLAPGAAIRNAGAQAGPAGFSVNTGVGWVSHNSFYNFAVNGGNVLIYCHTSPLFFAGAGGNVWFRVLRDGINIFQILYKFSGSGPCPGYSLVDYSVAAGNHSYDFNCQCSAGAVTWDAASTNCGVVSIWALA